MPDMFFIRLIDHVDVDEGMEVSWCIRHEEGELSQVHRGSLSEAAEAIADEKVIVLAPGNVTTSYLAQIPTQNRQRMLKAIPYALEEQLADDVDDLHFALGKNGNGTGMPVVVTSKERMDDWQARFQRLNIDVQMLIPAYLAIPYEENTWHLLVEEEGVMLRMSSQRGCYLDCDNVALLFGLLLEESEEKPQRLLVSNYGDCDLAPIEAFCNEHEIEMAVHDDGSMLEMAVKDFKTNEAFNLLQGEYSRREQLGRYWKPWIPTAAVVAGLIVVQLVSMSADYFRLSSHSAQLDEEIKAVYLAAFPDSRKVVNARAQMEQKLKEMGGTGGSDLFYQLLGGVSYLNENKVDFELQRIRYQNDELSVDLQLKNLQTLDKIKALLQQKSDVASEVLSASARGDKVEARLLLKGAAS